MFTKILKGFGITLLVIIGLFVSIGIWSGYKSAEYEETAIPYMTKAIHDISNWQLDTMKSYLASEVLEGVTDSDLGKVVNGLSRMGNLLELGEYQYQGVSTRAMAGGNSGTFVSYQVPAKYEKGNATLSITLKEVDNGFIVYNFNLNSLALFD
jgi:hypothetical protein